jgi:uncharacterized membrane protein YjjP (DUF1212 family)
MGRGEGGGRGCQFGFDMVLFMGHSIAQLHELTDEQVNAFHDEAAVNMSGGTDYWMKELARRSSERATAASMAAAEATNRLTAASVQLARRTFWLSVLSAAMSVIAVAVSVVALVAGT